MLNNLEFKLNSNNFEANLLEFKLNSDNYKIY